MTNSDPQPDSSSPIDRDTTSNPNANHSIEEVGASKLGLALFCFYTILYLGFVLINAFAADTMEMVVFAGLNLAIVYGFGLIIAAILLAFIYGFALRTQSGHQTGGKA